RWVHEQLNGLTSRIAATKISCMWVGPIWGQNTGPYHKTVAEVQDMSRLLSTSVAPCNFIESIAFAKPDEWPTRDGGHLQPDGYRKWAMAITGSIIKSRGQVAANSR